jgi:hypothetical protein
LLRAAAALSERARRAALLAVVVAASLTSGGARAEPASSALSRLDYVREAGAEACFAPEALIAGIEQRLGRRVFSEATSAALTTRVRARRERGRFVVDTALLDAGGRELGTRRLETSARHCSALDDSLALVLSLALDVRTAPASAETAAAPEPHPAPPAAPPPPAPLTVIQIPSTTLSPREPWRVAAELGGAIALGLLPEPAFGAHARIELEPPRWWSIQLGVALWREQRRGGARGAEFGAYSVELGVCPLGSAFESWRLTLCAQELLGRVRARGFGFERQVPEDRWLVALGAALGARYELGAAFLSLDGALLVPLIQRRYFFTAGDEVTLYDSPWWLGRLGVSFGINL